MTLHYYTPEGDKKTLANVINVVYLAGLNILCIDYDYHSKTITIDATKLSSIQNS